MHKTKGRIPETVRRHEYKHRKDTPGRYMWEKRTVGMMAKEEISLSDGTVLTSTVYMKNSGK